MLGQDGRTPHLYMNGTACYVNNFVNVIHD